MLGANISAVGWPDCGEIDIVENKGNALTVQGSLHSGSDETQTYALPGGSVTNFHDYVLEWTTNAISWFVDGVRYETQTNWSDSAGPYPIPFNQTFFLILNVAVGGDYIGNPSAAAINAGSTFPGQMIVDYVRLYNLTGPLRLTAAGGGGKLSLTWPTNIVCHLESATNLSRTADWTNVPGASPPFLAAPLSMASFYRLVSP
jgi:beta-glucanase (GH16 family)